MSATQNLDAIPAGRGLAPPAWRQRVDARLADVGDWLARHQRALRATQWMVVAVYLVLVAVPAFLALPDRTAHLFGHLTLFAQFAFWGLWWPFVLLSMVLVGRSWCGLFCPEGALTEVASGASLGRAVPRWLTWAGWPFTAFALTTVYGQMVSVYQYPKPVLVVLGGSTLAAVAVGLVYGRNKRVWCRYLCPVNGVFAVLAKLAPVAFRTDRAAWAASERPRAPINCAPLVPIRTMRGAGTCHMCGRCSGYRGAVQLALRSPNHEIVEVAGDRPDPWQSALILYGLMGVAVGAFHWTASPWFSAEKGFLAEWLVDHGHVWLLGATLPWWLLTNYPAQNDVMTLLDGVVLLSYVAATALVLGTALSLLVALAARILGPWSGARFHHLVQSLIPLAGCGVFLGLSALTVGFLRGEGIDPPYLAEVRALLLAGASAWAIRLAWRIAGRTAGGLRRCAATGAVAAASLVACTAWGLLFFVW